MSNFIWCAVQTYVSCRWHGIQADIVKLTKHAKNVLFIFTSFYFWSKNKSKHHVFIQKKNSIIFVDKKKFYSNFPGTEFYPRSHESHSYSYFFFSCKFLQLKNFILFSLQTWESFLFVIANKFMVSYRSWLVCSILKNVYVIFKVVNSLIFYD